MLDAAPHFEKLIRVLRVAFPLTITSYYKPTSSTVTLFNSFSDSRPSDSTPNQSSKPNEINHGKKLINPTRKQFPADVTDAVSPPPSKKVRLGAPIVASTSKLKRTSASLLLVALTDPTTTMTNTNSPFFHPKFYGCSCISLDSRFSSRAKEEATVETNE
jgi:type IV secretory pathway VirB10-like protein